MYAAFITFITSFIFLYYTHCYYYDFNKDQKNNIKLIMISTSIVSMYAGLNTYFTIGIIDSIVYYYGFFILFDIYFFIIHKIMHHKKIYLIVHKQHHNTDPKNMIALDFINQHPLEMAVAFLPFLIVPFLMKVSFNVHLWCILTQVIFGLAGHSNKPILKNPILIIVTLPIGLLKILTKELNVRILSNVKRHHIHHITRNENYGLNTLIMEKNAPISDRHGMNIFICLVMGLISISSYWKIALFVYINHLITEFNQQKTNAFLKYIHHPATIIVSTLAIVYAIDQVTWVFIMCNVIQVYNYIVLYYPSLYKKTYLKGSLYLKFSIMLVSYYYYTSNYFITLGFLFTSAIQIKGYKNLVNKINSTAQRLSKLPQEINKIY